jgi:hypothetical protein
MPPLRALRSLRMIYMDAKEVPVYRTNMLETIPDVDGNIVVLASLLSVTKGGYNVRRSIGGNSKALSRVRAVSCRN